MSEQTNSRFQAGQPVDLVDHTIPVQRLLGFNPGPMTGPGTNSYLLGRNRCCLIDPGPNDPQQIDTFLAVLDGRPLDAILVTHTHGDHSPAAQELARQTGAELIGLPVPDAGHQDRSFVPDRSWQHGDRYDCDGISLRFLHTPGHVSNHLCYFAEAEGLLFTGDHVLQGTTPVILPPDGDMSDYLASLEMLLALPLRYLAPGHGELMSEPEQEIKQLIAHRLKREAKIVDSLQKLGEPSLDELVLLVYDDVPGHLLPWAKKTLAAHLIKLERDGRAHADSSEPVRWSLCS